MLHKASKGFDNSKESQQEQIKSFLFNEKDFSIYITCVLVPRCLQFIHVDHEVLENMVKYHFTNFTTTRDDILFPFNIVTINTDCPISNEEIELPTLKFYILDGKHTISK